MKDWTKDQIAGKQYVVPNRGKPEPKRVVVKNTKDSVTFVKVKEK